MLPGEGRSRLSADQHAGEHRACDECDAQRTGGECRLPLTQEGAEEEEAGERPGHVEGALQAAGASPPITADAIGEERLLTCLRNAHAAERHDGPGHGSARCEKQREADDRDARPSDDHDVAAGPVTHPAGHWLQQCRDSDGGERDEPERGGVGVAVREQLVRQQQRGEAIGDHADAEPADADTECPPQHPVASGLPVDVGDPGRHTVGGVQTSLVVDTEARAIDLVSQHVDFVSTESPLL